MPRPLLFGNGWKNNAARERDAKMETPPLDIYPLWVVIVDYALGVVMWTLIGRSAMNFFLSEDSDFFFMRVFVKATDPILRVFRPITPGFLLEPMVPLFVAWFFFMVRFYLLPWLLGYHVMGMLSFPLESEIARMLYNIFN